MAWWLRARKQLSQTIKRTRSGGVNAECGPQQIRGLNRPSVRSKRAGDIEGLLDVVFQAETV